MNSNNIFSAILHILVGVGLVYLTYTPLMQFYTIMPTALQVIASIAWFILVGYTLFLAPMQALMADDTGVIS